MKLRPHGSHVILPSLFDSVVIRLMLPSTPFGSLGFRFQQHALNHIVIDPTSILSSSHTPFLISRKATTMASPPYMSSRSPPPLHHPKPTHPAYPPPEPPHTPGRSTASSPYSQTGRLSQDIDGYARYSSPPVGFDNHNHGGPGGHHAAAASSAYAPQGATGQMHSRAAAAGYAPQGPNAPVGYGANFAWPGVNDATAQMGVQFGRSAISAGQSYVQQNVSYKSPRFKLTGSSAATFPSRWSRRASRSRTAMC